nr:GNAT family N-acetyltransferase [Marinilactibacillus kalidii]
MLRGVDVHRTDQAIEKQNVYIVYSDEALLGVFILLEEQSAWDAQLWGRETSDDIVYLHRVALGHQVHGKGSGKELVKAAIKVAKNKEKKIVRLDCISTNQYLNHFYSSIGFLLVEEHKRNEPHSQSSFNLYEKRL